MEEEILERIIWNKRSLAFLLRWKENGSTWFVVGRISYFRYIYVRFRGGRGNNPEFRKTLMVLKSIYAYWKNLKQNNELRAESEEEEESHNDKKHSLLKSLYRRIPRICLIYQYSTRDIRTDFFLSLSFSILHNAREFILKHFLFLCICFMLKKVQMT